MKDFLQDQEVRTMQWPGNSPDLNPIEELWKILGERVMRSHPTNKKELIAGLIRVWHHEMQVDLIQRLVESMPNRCEAVIQAKGDVTKY